MTEYEELLSRPEWKIRRLEILERDKYTCVNCNNKILHEHCQSVYFDAFNPVKDDLVLLSGELDSPSNDHVTAFIPQGFFDMYVKDNPKKFFYIRENKENKNVVTIVSVAEFDDKGITKVLTTRGLHVHHQYYQDDFMPWEYPDKALKTLCWYCHEKLHEGPKVPRYTKDGTHYADLTPCKRCHGAGVFPQYSHVEFGICFRCRGAKYEELIEESDTEKTGSGVGRF